MKRAKVLQSLIGNPVKIWNGPAAVTGYEPQTYSLFLVKEAGRCGQ